MTLPTGGFVRSGYTLVGWTPQMDGSGVTYLPGATVKNLTTTDNGYVVFNARWKQNSSPTPGNDPNEPAATEQVVDHGDGTYTITMVKGNKVTIPALAKQKSYGKAYSAYSGNKRVATISSKGTIKAKSAGTCTLTVVIRGQTFTCDVLVTVPGFSRKTLCMNVRDNNGVAQIENVGFTGTTLPVTYSIPVKQQSIATVDSEGNVKALRRGKVKLTANVCGKKYTCTVCVYDPMIKPPKSERLRLGKKMTLKVTGGAKSTDWWTLDPSVAVVNSKGKVTGTGRGETIVYAMNNGIVMSQRIIVY